MASPAGNDGVQSPRLLTVQLPQNDDANVTKSPCGENGKNFCMSASKKVTIGGKSYEITVSYPVNKKVSDAQIKKDLEKSIRMTTVAISSFGGQSNVSSLTIARNGILRINNEPEIAGVMKETGFFTKSIQFKPAAESNLDSDLIKAINDNGKYIYGLTQNLRDEITVRHGDHGASLVEGTEVREVSEEEEEKAALEREREAFQRNQHLSPEDVSASAPLLNPGHGIAAEDGKP